MATVLLSGSGIFEARNERRVAGQEVQREEFYPKTIRSFITQAIRRA